MNYFNEIKITGNLGVDPKLIETKKPGTTMAVFSLAHTPSRFNETTRQWDKYPTEWHNIKLFNEVANEAMESLKKGDLVTVVGRLSVREYQTKDGKKATSNEINALHVQKEEFSADKAAKERVLKEKEELKREIEEQALLEKAFSDVHGGDFDPNKTLSAFSGGIGPTKDVTLPIGRAYALRKWGINRGIIQENVAG